MENLPSPSVVVPREVPDTVTATPGNGTPASSRTVPVTSLLCCATTGSAMLQSISVTKSNMRRQRP